MNNLNVSELKITGVGTVTKAKSVLEKFAEEENEAEIQKTVATEEITAVEAEISKHSISEIIPEENETFVEAAKASGTTPELKISTKPGFDPNTVANVMSRDDGIDGGIMTGKMNNVVSEGSILKSIGPNTKEISVKNQCEISGFSIQYIPKGTKSIASREVVDYYDDIDDAKKRFNGDSYFTQDGVIAKISRGAPIICVEDRQKFEYVNEEWRRC
jgi:hypothetical protein